MGKWANLAVLLLLALGFFVQQLLDTEYTPAWAEHNQRRQRLRLALEYAVVAIFLGLVAITLVGNIVYIRKQRQDKKEHFSLLQYIFAGHEHQTPEFTSEEIQQLRTLLSS